MNNIRYSIYFYNNDVEMLIRTNVSIGGNIAIGHILETFEGLWKVRDIRHQADSQGVTLYVEKIN